MSECEVCIEKFNKSNRTLVKCKCEYICCKDCAKKYLLSSNKPMCMNCNIEWDRNFLHDNFEKVFLDTQYKVHRENVLLEKELALLPEAQDQIDKDKLIKENQENIRDIKSEIHYLQREIFLLQDEINHVKYSNPGKSTNITKCPKIDCRGYLNTFFICKICSIECCKDCKEIKTKNHICDDKILQSLKLIEQDSVHCPCCDILVHRISGCETLFCSPLYSGCGTFFNYTTRKIQRYSHNPEHDLYQKELNNGFIPREHGDIICGRDLDNDFINDIRNSFTIHCDSNYNYYEKKHGDDDEDVTTKSFIRMLLFRNFKECVNIILINVVHNLKYNKIYQFNNSITDNMDLRKQYLLGSLSKDRMKFLLQKRDKNNNKNKEIYEILTTFIMCMTEIFYILKDSIDNCKPEELQEISDKFHIETENLRLHTNECLMKVKKCYNCCRYYLTPNFRFF